MAGSGDLLLPGFRFFPTDEELVGYYLRRKAFRGLSHDHVIADLDLYNFEPWDLPGLAALKSRDGQWFFFAPRERQQPGNTRNSRATKLGYWKTTGKDRKILQHCAEDHPMGLKKTLVYYQGRAPRGVRTDWVMYEYRIAGEYERARSVQSTFVVCKVFKKGGPGPRNGEQYGAPVDAETETETEAKAGTGTEIEIEEEEIREEEEDCESHHLPVTAIPFMAAIKQEQEDLLAFLNRPLTASRLMQPAPALSPDVATKISETHLSEENAWPDPAELAVADELFADLPSLANDVLFSDPSNHHMWASSSGGGGEEGSLLTEMLQTAKLAEESASRQEGGQGNETPSLPFYYDYYCPMPPPPDFAEAEDLMAMHHRDAAILAESTMMVKPAAQYSFHQPPSAPSEVRPELLHSHYFQLDCFYNVCLLTYCWE